MVFQGSSEQSLAFIPTFINVGSLIGGEILTPTENDVYWKLGKWMSCISDLKSAVSTTGCSVDYVVSTIKKRPSHDWSPWFH